MLPVFGRSASRVLPRLASAVPVRNFAVKSIEERMIERVPKMRAEFAEFKKQYGDKELGKITVGAVAGGMRGMTGLLYETSLLDEMEGIRFRGLSIPECQKLLPRAPGGTEPLPEAMLWLLLTGEVPSQEEVHSLSEDLRERAKKIPRHVIQLVDSFPKDMHPMSQLCAAVCLMQTKSLFATRYQDGTLNKHNYWEPTLEDALNLISYLPEVAAMIFRNTFRDGKKIAAVPGLDWGGNFAHMLGFDNLEFRDLMRLYLSVHSDHEGGNVSAHATHLVGSALSDPYLSYAAGMAGLAGPLHGLANQEVLRWILHFKEQFGSKPITKQALEEACWDTLKKGNVIPGFGHAVLRKTDPRYTSLREFAFKHLPNDPLFKLVSDLYEVVPPVLMKHGKTKNPWPNVDAHSGVLLYHYGLREDHYYTVLFGVSRALGVCSHLILDRIYGMPIERPKSVTTQWIKEHFASK